MKPKISVLMAVYNREDLLNQSITSVLNQTFTNFEFIISDNASTDNSLAIIKKYAVKDSRIKVLRNTTNLGHIKNRNILLNAAKADFIAWCDSDDVSIPERLQLQ